MLEIPAFRKGRQEDQGFNISFHRLHGKSPGQFELPVILSSNERSGEEEKQGKEEARERTGTNES